jgi:hypothetical protein
VVEIKISRDSFISQIKLIEWERFSQLSGKPRSAQIARVISMSSSKNSVPFGIILGFIGVVVGVLANVAYFQEGGRVSIISLGLYPVLGFALGSWIDGKRNRD